MASRQELDQLMKRIRAVEKETGGNTKDDEMTEEQLNADPFIRLKQEIGRLERETRNDIKARDEFAENASTRDQKPEIVKQTTAIKQKVKELRAKSDQLRSILHEEAEKMKKQNKTSEGLDNRKKMCDLIDARIDEVERYAKGLKFISAKDDPNRRALLKDADEEAGAPTMATFVPGPTESEFQEIEGFDDWQLMINKGEQEIDQQLDILVDATSLLVNTANILSDEYKILGTMTDEVNEKLDKTNDKLNDANKRVKETIEKVGGGSNFCIDLFLILIILACVYFVITQFINF